MFNKFFFRDRINCKKNKKEVLYMRKEIIKQLLDSMLIEVKPRGIAANSMLSEEQEEMLYDIVDQFLGKKLTVEDAVKEVVLILQAIGYGSNITKIERKDEKDDLMKDKKGNVIYANINQDTMPFLIKQVLFYLCCSYIAENESNSQKGFLQLLSQCGFTLSHNFFTKLGYSPAYCSDILNYKQPENPMPYKGQKKDELAVAIKNLVYQAGTGIDYYVDIFGGSGSASTAVCPKKGLSIAYNELSTSVFNLFEVLHDPDLCKRFIKDLKKLQDDLKYGRPFIKDISDESDELDTQNTTGIIHTLDDFYELDFESENEKYRNEKKGKKSPVETDIAEDYLEDYEIDIPGMLFIMDAYRKSVKKQPDAYSFSFEGKQYSKSELLKYEGLAGYFCLVNGKFGEPIVYPYLQKELNKKDYETLLKSVSVYHDLEDNPQNPSVENLFSAKNKHIQYRFFKYYTYFWRLRQNNVISHDKKVLHALAEFFIQYLTTKGKIGISPVMRMYKHPKIKNLDYQTHKFIGTDHTIVIGKFHECIKAFSLSNIFDLQIISRYKRIAEAEEKKVLFYSDSPYLETSTYKENNIDAFTAQNMKELIELLMSGGEKFIFSCRAAKSQEQKKRTDEERSDEDHSYDIDSTGVFATNKNTRESNQIIYEHVFDVFRKAAKDTNKKLYVLAIEKGGDLADLVKSNKISEIMITNYPIQSFINIMGYEAEEKTNYTVYSFEDFMKILDANMNK